MPAETIVGEGALIVPVELPVAARRLRDRMDPSAALGVPPHVTLLYPFMPPELVDDEARRRITQIVAAEPAFPFSLTRVGRWPDVVYLPPEPDKPFRRLIEALAAAFREYPPYGGVHAEVVPHVTIAQDPRAGYLAAAEHALPAMLPIRDVAREVLLIGHSVGPPWRTHLHLPLAGAAGR
jgi:2'-5' RNA ligase